MYMHRGFLYPRKEEKMKKYNEFRMEERLIRTVEQTGEICVCDFPDYDEHDTSEIKGILKNVAAQLEDYGYEVVTYPVPKCGWGLATRMLLEAKIRFPWG